MWSAGYATVTVAQPDLSLGSLSSSSFLLPSCASISKSVPIYAISPLPYLYLVLGQEGNFSPPSFSPSSAKSLESNDQRCCFFLMN